MLDYYTSQMAYGKLQGLSPTNFCLIHLFTSVSFTTSSGGTPIGLAYVNDRIVSLKLDAKHEYSFRKQVIQEGYAIKMDIIQVSPPI